MNAREKRIRILDLQDEYCRNCEYNTASHTYCRENCEIGEKIAKLGEEICRSQQGRKVITSKQWDSMCKQAVSLHEQGVGYTIIAKKLGCHASSLRGQLKKRGLWNGESQKEIQEKSRKKWDRLCQQAIKLKEIGLSYPEIARQLDIATKSLRDQMSRRRSK
ncbi:hypothetical protein IKE_05745 [Bacillus cereus VD196]|uniref:Zinc-finger domain-containing protein n=1 Tax=Bacillus cereus VD196 TaxID=1053243 RepID=A0A9W5PYS0_BACCE|nr:zinc-finger domain-containing protein [Bacillus cereus]EJR91159.1 hypothetical protein IKG_05796 [Bacillus cereus VD200]EOO62085.1 hypothetical protein IKE_05745 [Bacillus cereus VD196]